MEQISSNTRLCQIPILHARGTHETVGYIIGRQFKAIIEDVVNRWAYFNQVVLPTFLTTEGKRIYDQSFRLCSQKYPGYIAELQGMAAGSGVPFYKLFLLHIDTLVASSDSGSDQELIKKQVEETGCTTVMCNGDEVLLGHTEDACPEFLNNVFLLSAEILDDCGVLKEKFVSLTYAGHLPGYTMGYNMHGMVYSVNTIFLKKSYSDRTPRLFLARAILAVSTLVEALDILKDKGTGTADGFSLNIHFSKQEGSPIMHNVEVSPYRQGDKAESDLSVFTLTHGDTHVHCNKFLRLEVQEERGVAYTSSDHRLKTINKHLKPNSLARMKEILSDETDEEFPVFRRGASKPDYVKTVCVGIFDLSMKKWSIYIDPPSVSEPVVVLPLEL